MVQYKVLEVFGSDMYVVVQIFLWFKNFQTSLIFVFLCLGMWQWI